MVAPLLLINPLMGWPARLRVKINHIVVLATLNISILIQCVQSALVGIFLSVRKRLGSAIVFQVQIQEI